MSAYYNEIDPYCAKWLRNLIDAGHIPAGDVDDRPIQEVQPDDLKGYTQAHFFAGIGGWAYAARLAGWSDDAELWTGSCPCQPYSNAGSRLADDDPRNLWPEFRRLVADVGPERIAGEQVASAAGRLWLAGVHADLEALGYSFGAADLCAAGVGAPHIRQRLWWVADHDGEGCSEQRGSGLLDGERSAQRNDPDGRGPVRGLGHAGSTGSGRDSGAVLGAQAQGRGRGQEAWSEPDELVSAGADSGLGDSSREGLQTPEYQEFRGTGRRIKRRTITEPCRAQDPWEAAAWLPCADGKARRIEPGIEPLSHGVPARVGQLRAYGNAIVPQVAAEVLIAAFGNA